MAEFIETYREWFTKGTNIIGLVKGKKRKLPRLYCPSLNRSNSAEIQLSFSMNLFLFDAWSGGWLCSGHMTSTASPTDVPLPLHTALWSLYLENTLPRCHSYLDASVLFLHNKIELIVWQVDLVWVDLVASWSCRVDLVAIDLVRIDLMKGNPGDEATIALWCLMLNVVLLWRFAESELIACISM